MLLSHLEDLTCQPCAGFVFSENLCEWQVILISYDDLKPEVFWEFMLFKLITKVTLKKSA